jgi:ABC-2 type transport system ATP-binding protein
MICRPGASRLDTMDSETAVMVRDLGKRYGDVAAVNGLDLDIGRGEIFALLGPNGAGKTTTVEILEGFRHRDRGTVAVLGHDPDQPSRAWRARIGIVLQLASAGPELTVLEMVRHFAGLYPGSRDPQEVIELVGLTAKARSRTGVLSGGQARRLDVALGIVGRPELLFLDEPTTGFDPEARRQFWDLIASLRSDGTTIVLTTHYLDEAEALADRIAVIAAGRIVATGDPRSLGGRDGAAARVSWAAAPGRPATTVETTTPTRLVAELSAQLGGEVPGLTVTRPTLEDIYLELIAEVTP